MLEHKRPTTPSKYGGEGARVACLLDFLILCHNGKEVEPWTVQYHTRRGPDGMIHAGKTQIAL